MPDLSPLSARRHGGWTLRPGAGLPDSGLVPAGLAEATALAAGMPVLFAPGPSGWGTFALLAAAGARHSPLQLPDGRFRGLRPAALAAAPFCTAPDPETDPRLWLNESSPLLQKGPGGAALFGADGAASALTRAAAGVLSAWAPDLQAARRAAAALAAAGLFSPLTHAAAPTGLFGITAAALDGLDPALLAPLQAAGALRLAWTHRVSLAHLPTLAHHADLSLPEGAPSADTQGFLAAMTAPPALSHEAGG